MYFQPGAQDSLPVDMRSLLLFNIRDTSLLGTFVQRPNGFYLNASDLHTTTQRVAGESELHIMVHPGIFVIKYVCISAAAGQETPYTGPTRTSESSYRGEIEAKCVVLVFNNVFNCSSAVLCRKAGNMP